MQEIQAFWNDSYLPLSEVKISPFDRGFLFGDGVYEVVKIYRGKPWLLGPHLKRLASSLEKIHITLEVESLLTPIAKLLDNISTDGSLYIQITRGAASKRAHAFPKESIKPSVLIYADRLVDDPLKPLRESGVKTLIVPETRWAKPNIKSINLLANCLAKQDAYDHGAFEAIFRKPDGFLTEGSSSNFFIVKNGVVSTTKNDGQILPGISRAFVIELCGREKVPCFERDISEKDLLGADEAFLTSTMSEVLPIIQIGEQIVGNGTPGAITKELRSLFLAATSN